MSKLKKHRFLKVKHKKYDNPFWVLEITSLFELLRFLSTVHSSINAEAVFDLIRSQVKGTHLTNSLASYLKTKIEVETVQKGEDFEYSIVELSFKLDRLTSEPKIQALQEYGKVWIHRNYIGFFTPLDDEYEILEVKEKEGWDFPREKQIFKLSQWVKEGHWYITNDSGELIKKVDTLEQAKRFVKRKYPDSDIVINNKPKYYYSHTGD